MNIAHLLRRGCGCLLILLVVMVVLGLLLGLALARGAEGAFAASPPVTVVQLAPPIPEQASAGVLPDVFFQSAVTVTITGEDVWLSSLPAGSGALCTDDAVSLTIVPLDAPHAARHWSHQFSSADRQTIVCLPPQPVSPALAPGRYRFEVALADHLPPQRSSRPILLVLVPVTGLRAIAPATAAVASAAATATVPPTQPLPTTWPVPEQLSVSESPSRSPPTPIVSTPSAGDQQPVRVSWFAARWLPPFWASIWIATVGMLLGIGLLARKRRRRIPTSGLSGVISLSDSETGAVCTALLHQFPQGAVLTRRPLGVVQPNSAALPVAGTVVAKVVTGRQGPLLITIGPDGSQEQTELLAMRRYTLAGGMVVLHYRS